MRYDARRRIKLSRTNLSRQHLVGPTMIYVMRYHVPSSTNPLILYIFIPLTYIHILKQKRQLFISVLLRFIYFINMYIIITRTRLVFFLSNNVIRGPCWGLTLARESPFLFLREKPFHLLAKSFVLARKNIYASLANIGQRQEDSALHFEGK